MAEKLSEPNKAEETIPRYISYAVILLTAEHLGIVISYPQIAHKVWETQRRPESVMALLFETSAREAKEEILAKGLGKKGDELAYRFVETGSFEEKLHNENQ